MFYTGWFILSGIVFHNNTKQKICLTYQVNFYFFAACLEDRAQSFHETLRPVFKKSRKKVEV